MSQRSLEPLDLGHRIAVLLAGYPSVAAAWLFGSVTRGELGPASDIDIGLLFRERGTGDATRHRLLGELAARLEAFTRPHTVDLITLETQGPMFRYQVLREGRCIFEADRERRIDFETDTIVQALDFRPTFESAAREQVGGMQRWLQRYRA